MTPAPKRRWPRFSLRTMFVVVTVFGCWLGWNIHCIRERDVFYARGARFVPAKSTSWSYRLRIAGWIVGTMPLEAVLLPSSRFSIEDHARATKLFPEARVVMAGF